MTLPLATLFQAPTLERQAELIDQRWTVDAPWQALVPIQPAGSRPAALRDSRASGGIVVGFNDLARLLGPDQPFYALCSRGVSTASCRRSRAVEEAAEHYLGEVRALQPQGPYFLLGVCMGGVVALEMAQRLRKAPGRWWRSWPCSTCGRPIPVVALDPDPAARRRMAGAVVRLIGSRVAAYGRSPAGSAPRDGRRAKSSTACDISSPRCPPVIRCAAPEVSSTDRW